MCWRLRYLGMLFWTSVSGRGVDERCSGVRIMEEACLTLY